MKKMLHVSYSLNTQSGALSGFQTLKGYIKNGYAITVFLPASKNEVKVIEKIEFIYVKIPFRKKTNIVGLRFLKNQFDFILGLIFIFYKTYNYSKKHPQDIFYGHMPFGAIICHFLGQFLKQPNVSRFYGVVRSYLYLTKSVFNFKRFSYWQTYLSFKLSADLYIITNDGTSGDKLAAHFKIPKNKYRFYYNGINKNIPQTRIEKRDKIVILSLSRLHILKRIDRLINAIPKVVSKCKNVKFVIVGSGEEKSNLINLANNLNVSEYISFKGKVDNNEVYNIMKNADVFCAVSDYSNVTNPVFESMAVGLPAVLTNSGSTATFIDNYVNGIIIDEMEVAEKLPLKIIELVENIGLRKKLGTNANKFIMSEFLTWDERIQLEVNDINKILDNK